MSYDVYFVAEMGEVDQFTGKPCKTVLPHLLDWNYTSNVARMWREAMPETDGLVELSGMKAAEAAKHIEAGIERMEADPEKYKAMNPPNGWGDFDGQLSALRELLGAFRLYPDAEISVGY